MTDPQNQTPSDSNTYMSIIKMFSILYWGLAIVVGIPSGFVGFAWALPVYLAIVLAFVLLLLLLK